jgi:hypothetical protein
MSSTMTSSIGISDAARSDERALWAAVVSGEWPREAGARLGIPHRRVVYLCSKWGRRGIYDWGVCIDIGWVNSD